MSDNWLTVETNTRQGNGGEGDAEYEMMQDTQIGITTHYYWSSGIWTTGKDNDCSYVQNLSLLANQLLRPQMLVIEPNSLENINLLSHYDGSRVKNDKMGHFRNYVYFSKQCTGALKMLIDTQSTLIDPQRVFQFESRYFQYSLLQNKVCFVHTRHEYRNHLSGKNEFAIKEFLVFRFWHQSKNKKDGIFGIAQRTDCGNPRNKHIYQPWQCTDIVEESNMLKYFGLAHASEGSQSEFLSLLPMAVECYKKPFNNSIDCKFDPNFNKIGGILRRGFERYREGLMWDSMSEDSYKNGGAYGNHNNNNRRVRKNEPKFEYLDQIAKEMNLGFDELIGEILDSIKRSFDFAKKNPNHVLTQAYIDEQNCQIFYESVLLAEMTDKKKSKTFTFGVPIADFFNDDDALAPPCYLAESVLTPQMTIENILLNTEAEQFDEMKQASWISRMSDGLSFYKMCEESGETYYATKEGSTTSNVHPSATLTSVTSGGFATPSGGATSGAGSGVSSGNASHVTSGGPSCNYQMKQQWPRYQSWNSSSYYY